MKLKAPLTLENVTMNDEQKITKIALYSRLILILLQYVSNELIPDHDAGVFLYPKTTIIPGYYDKEIEHFFGGFKRWDAQYFIHIALYGYTYENTLAFLPLYPYIVRFVSLILNSVITFLNLESTVLIVSILLNVILFKYSAVTLYRLTTHLFNQKIAFVSAILFCLNPSSIFFVAPYTETIFSFLTFKSMLNSVLMYKNQIKSNNSLRFFNDLCQTTIFIGLSTVVRSNGIINIGFLGYSLISIFLKRFSSKNIKSKSKLVVKFLMLIVFSTCICLLPFIAYQYYCYKMFCTNFDNDLPKNVIDLARNKQYVLPGAFNIYNQTWCHDKIPLAYSFVQDKYWKVGFLKYYELKQLPNFILALPILLVITLNCIKYLYLFLRFNVSSIFTFDKMKSIKKDNCTFNVFVPHIFVFIIHVFFLDIFCILFIHIQVSTRFLCSASPVFYWFCAKHLRSLNLTKNYNSLLELTLKTYFLSYFIAGTLLFCNFLPWT